MSENIPVDSVLNGDSLTVLKTLPESSVHCCVTSPPYYAMRDYEAAGQIGREDTPEEYIGRLVAVFHEVYRVLKPHGVFWLNIADTYCKSATFGYKVKDMFGIPWRLALALRADGWYLRSDVIWQKTRTTPESVKDRCTRSYEHVFQLAKSRRYYFDHAAIAEPMKPGTIAKMKNGQKGSPKYSHVPGRRVMQGIYQPKPGLPAVEIPTHRNKRDVWVISPVMYAGAHFATTPPKLVEICILAGCPVGGIVLDPFLGSGTTGMVAKQLNRHYIGIEINPQYCELARARIATARPIF